MTSRERVRTALDFREPDRVPIDLGSNLQSGIMAHALDGLRRHLGLPRRRVKVHEVFQMLGEVEPDVVDRLGADILPVEPLVQFFGLRRENWKPWRLWDGTGVLVPGQFDVDVDAEGGWLLHAGGDPARPVEGRMPRGGFYFDMPSLTESLPGWQPPALAQVRGEHLLDTRELEHMQARAAHLRAATDKALMLGAWDATGLPWVGGIPDFLMLLATDRAYVKDLFAARTDVALRNLERLKAHLGDSIDIIGMEGTDYAGQDRELINPGLFEELCVPFFRQQNTWVHEHTSWKTWYHCCGSIPRLLPPLIDAGVDIINPVQTSAAGMDPRVLKERFGGRIVFWGAGIDTQHTLPFASPEEVAAEVRERIRIFAPGGGFVFNPIHNIQQGTPPANITAAYDAARAAGTYPIGPLSPVNTPASSPPRRSTRR
jgi:hypothetical protein